jgi:hypothetical protein
MFFSFEKNGKKESPRKIPIKPSPTKQTTPYNYLHKIIQTKEAINARLINMQWDTHKKY